ncbi:tyrosine recombinase XerC, partial [Frankia sp. Cj3]|uniref:site-specific integrase n=2 Tax=unclassified Frankia TaxID=2632575 RepID=UPI001EF51698
IGSLIKEATARGGELPTIDGVRRRVNAGVALDKSITVGEWLDNWLNGKRDIKKTTRNGYESNIRVYLKPHLGHLPLDKLQISQIDAMFDRIQEADDELTELRERASRGEEVDFNRRQRITSAATRQRIRATLRSSLSAAIKRELIASNPAKHVSLASGKRPKALVWTRARTENWWAGYSRAISQLDERARKSVVRQFKLWKETPRPSKVMVWTPEQTGAFLDDVTSDRLSPCLHLIVFSGLRRGEACGVSWPDIDLDDGVLHVSWQLVLHGWEVAGDTPKADSVRDIPLDPVTIAVLRWWRGQQDRERDGWDPAWTDSVRVFTREDGSDIHPSFLSYRFQRLAFAAQLPPIRLHDLRHGAATLALAGGTDLKIVQELLGHSSITITADTYTSVLPDLTR